MSMRDEDFGDALTLAEAGDGFCFPAVTAPTEPDWKSLYEEAEALAEALRRSERDSRIRASSLENRLGNARRKLAASVEEVKEVRRASKDALFHQSEAARLEKLLRQAGVESGKDCTLMSLRKKVFRLEQALEAEKARRDSLPPSPAATLSGSAPKPGSTVRRQAREIERLRKQLDRSEEQLQSRQDTIRELRGELRASRKEEARLQKKIAGFGDLPPAVELAATVKSLHKENAALEKRAKAAERDCRWLKSRNSDQDWLIRRIGEYREKQEIRHREDMDRLRKELARERSYRCGEWHRQQDAIARAVCRMERQLERMRRAVVRAKDTMESVRRSRNRFRTEARESRALAKETVARNEVLEAQVEQLRSTRAVLSKATFGRKGERQDRPATGRNRGQQPGSPGHGRTPRPGLREKEERRDPPEDARTCPCCGEPYVPNGERSATVIEIQVKAHVRKIVRGRWRRGCDCASSPREVIAPPEPRLFPGTLYGTTVWARFLFEACASLRPLCQVAAWLADQGMPVSPGTLADSLKRFLPLFEPLAAAILAHQNKAAVRHVDETGWRVQEFRKTRRSHRAWLWVSVTGDAVCFHISASRSARVAKVLFMDVAGAVVVVCDRYSAYKRLASDLGGKVILQWCWAHQRRSFIDCAAGHPRLARWCEGWIERIAEIYRLNGARLKHYDPDSGCPTPAFDAAQAELEAAVARLFADAGEELAALPEKARKGKALRSLLKHRDGLCVFVGRPDVPMDNNAAERAIRRPAIGRKLTFGSNSRDGARFTAVMQSVVGTLAMNGIDVLKWLEAWLKACAENGGKPPDDLSPWLPWSMSAEQKQRFIAPG